jgi:hypothetical protein
VTITFVHSQGNLELELYDGNRNRLRYSSGYADQEQIIIRGLRPGGYFIRVYGGSVVTNRYRMVAVAGVPLYPADGYEENDSFETAAAISLPFDQSNLTIDYGGDDDYYRFSLSATQDVTVTITFVHSQGNLELELYDGNRNRLRYSSGYADQEQIIIRGLRPGGYFIRVYGGSVVTNRYRLVVTATLSTMATP